MKYYKDQFACGCALIYKTQNDKLVLVSSTQCRSSCGEPVSMDGCSSIAIDILDLPCISEEDVFLELV